MEQLCHNHWKEAKGILRYIKGTLLYGLQYGKVADFKLQGYSDSDWAGCSDKRESTTGYTFRMGSAIISWISERQPTVALSSTEAEYKEAVSATCEAVWLKRILDDVGLHQQNPISLMCDNQSVIKIEKKPVYHCRTKHIEVHYHFI
jgi:hypothetical protein